jgi:hypothetical protein
LGNLIYSANASLDGYIADKDGKFDWAEPDDEVHAFINDLERPIGTYLLGRRMYEVLVYWEDPPALDQQPPYVQEFAEIWQAAEKIVPEVTSSNHVWRILDAGQIGRPVPSITTLRAIDVKRRAGVVARRLDELELERRRETLEATCASEANGRWSSADRVASCTGTGTCSN